MSVSSQTPPAGSRFYGRSFGRHQPWCVFLSFSLAAALHLSPFAPHVRFSDTPLSDQVKDTLVSTDIDIDDNGAASPATPLRLPCIATSIADNVKLHKPTKSWKA